MHGPKRSFLSILVCILHILDCLGQDMQVLYLGRAPRTKETLPDFLKWRRVTRPPLVFRGLTGSQRTPGFWGVTHLDRYGPFNIHARGGYEYFITFTNDYSRYGYVYLMKKKYEALDKFKEFKAKSKKQLGRYIKSLRYDRGGEYMSIEFFFFFPQGAWDLISA